MTQAQSSEEKARLKRQWTDLAVKLAQEGQWEEAVTTNRNILNLFPSEPDALNRLGKAYSELGQYEEAHRAYSQTIKYSPDNTIAKKNLERLALLLETPVKNTPAATPANVGRLGSEEAFLEETGKTGITELINLAPSTVLAKVTVADKVQLEVKGHTLLVQTLAGEVIGQVEPRLANRLINFMEGGNRYGAWVSAMDHGTVRVRIREVYQHPSMFGKVSFPSQGSNDGVRERAYVKESLVRQDREDDDDLGNEDEYYDGGDDSEDITELDFDGSTEGEE